MYYLVKWCSLPYEDSTWELKDDVDQSKIEEFEQLQAAKPDSRRVVSCACQPSSVIAVFPCFFITLARVHVHTYYSDLNKTTLTQGYERA